MTLISKLSSPAINPLLRSSQFTSLSFRQAFCGMHLLTRPRQGSLRHRQLQRTSSSGGSPGFQTWKSSESSSFSSSNNNQTHLMLTRHKSTSTPSGSAVDDVPEKISKKKSLMLAVRDFGSGIFVFHILMSLCSLGLCYLAVRWAELDVAHWMERLFEKDPDKEEKASRVMNSEWVQYFGLGTEFIIAYAIHKMLMPLRISITLIVAPILVTMVRLRTLSFRAAYKHLGGKAFSFRR